MSGFTGTRQALLFALKRDRLIIPLCLTGLVGWMAIYVISYTGLYGTQAELDALYRSVAGNPAVEAFSGPTGGLRSLGGAIAWDSTPALSIICALYAMFSVIRHSRAEEEDSRTDLLLASGSGRLAPLAAALIVTALVLVVAGAGFATALVIGGLEPVPSILLASAIVGFGLVFAGTTAVIAQVTTKARAARGLVGVVIGVSWVLRAIGDTSGGTLTWFSPLGWVQSTRPFWEDRWWPLALFVAAPAITVSVAFWLLARRDIGSGLIPPRPAVTSSAALPRPGPAPPGPRPCCFTPWAFLFACSEGPSSAGPRCSADTALQSGRSATTSKGSSSRVPPSVRHLLRRGPTCSILTSPRLSP
mgnify:CR=1 FL=1